MGGAETEGKRKEERGVGPRVCARVCVCVNGIRSSQVGQVDRLESLM